jgi:hypothetical protein
MQHSTQIGIAKAVLAVLALAASAHADSIPITYSLSGMGTVVGSTNTTLTLDGQFSGSVLSGDPNLNAAWNPVSYTDHSVADLTTGLLNGTFSFVFANGETLSGNVSEDVSAVIANGTGAFTQTLSFTGGTGEFAGVTGSASGSGSVDTTVTTVSGSGTLNTAAVPEPSPAALLVGALALMVARRCRLGRSGARKSALGL